MNLNMNKKRRAYSGTTGRVAEVRFKRAAENLDLIVTRSQPMEDMHQHIDYWLAVNKNGKRWGVDVKGNNLPDEIWCEFRNVMGNPGWMYGGARIIAFDMPEVGGFVIVNRDELAFWCEKNVTDEVVTDKSKAYRKKYTRKDRSDVITKLNVYDLKELKSYRVWEYDKTF
jgi:hypothetical protein